MAEIDTAAPFASVRDAVYMFDDHTTAKTTERAFLTTNALQIEKIHCLEIELHRLRDEHMDTKNQLLIAETNASNAIKELQEFKVALKETSRRGDEIVSSKISLLESQLEVAREQETQRLEQMNCNRKEIKDLGEKVNDMESQQLDALEALRRAQEENNALREEMDSIVYRHEQHLKEQEDIAAERMKDLLLDFSETKDMLANMDAARANIEDELENWKKKDLERTNNEALNYALEIKLLKKQLKDAKDKQEEICLVVERLKEELIMRKETERKALQGEMDANVALQKSVAEVEESKIGNEKVNKMFLIQIEEMKVDLEIATRNEENLLTSLASLNVELENTRHDLYSVKIEAEEKTIEMKEVINQLQTSLNVALKEEARTKECISNLNEAIQQVTTEAVEAKAATTQAIEEVVVRTQDLQEATLHNKTLECKLEAAMKEIEALKAAEVFAHTKSKFFKKTANKNIDAEETRKEVTISYEEYETMTKRIFDCEDLAKKRTTAALAQVDAYKASEYEMSKKMESIKNLLEKNESSMKQAVQVAETAEAAKFAIEDELRMWRSENELRRKAAVAAVMAVGNNEVDRNCNYSHLANNSCSGKMTHADESNGGLFHCSANPLKPKQSLAEALQFNFSRSGKTPKNLLPKRISSYFNKKIRQKIHKCKILE